MALDAAVCTLDNDGAAPIGGGGACHDHTFHWKHRAPARALSTGRLRALARVLSTGRLGSRRRPPRGAGGARRKRGPGRSAPRPAHTAWPLGTRRSSPACETPACSRRQQPTDRLRAVRQAAHRPVRPPRQRPPRRPPPRRRRLRRRRPRHHRPRHHRPRHRLSLSRRSRRDRSVHRSRRCQPVPRPRARQQVRPHRRRRGADRARACQVSARRAAAIWATATPASLVKASFRGKLWKVP